MEMEMKGGSDWLELMIGTAKEELERLESNHPNQFEFFKVELKSFISLHQQKQQHPTLSNSTIATQASTSGMKRKNACFMEKPNKVEEELEAVAASGIMKWKRGCFGTLKGGDEKKRKRVKVGKEDERVEVALGRGKACLQKIHELKAHLLYP